MQSSERKDLLFKKREAAIKKNLKKRKNKKTIIKAKNARVIR